MARFAKGTYFPRSGAAHWHHLAALYGADIEQLERLPFDLQRADFHSAGELRITTAELTAWRDELNAWARDWGYPGRLNEALRSEWDVAFGERLLADTHGIPESQHPAVWCWIATYLLPHFGIYRWGWPTRTNGEAPLGRAAWSRFGASERNGLLLVRQRVKNFGANTCRKATEQEFQSILNRPAFGRDQRVSRVILRTLVESYDDPESCYGKHGGSRALDTDDVCIELRVINSLRPLCFATDEEIVAITKDAIHRLPTYRKQKPEKSPKLPAPLGP